jgi:NADPH:quinone reductase-like Zn-dependent oxidoreductase
MDTMKAVCIHSFGGPEVLKLEELPVPEPAADELLIHVKAASANPIDYKMRSGAYAQADQLPMRLGRDVSGTVERCGTTVQDWHPGDDVFAMLPSDRYGFAEYVTLKASDTVHKPSNLDYEHAAAVPLAALTAWQGLFDHGKLKVGRRVLIHGAAGGVGHFAVQFAKWVGAEVIATASRNDTDFLRDLGANRVIDYKSEKFEDQVSDVDLVFDLVGGETQERSWAVLKRGGRLISTVAEPDQDKARERGAQGKVYMAKTSPQQLAQIARLIEKGSVRPQLQATFPLREVAKAEEHIEREHSRGKTVLTIH